MKKTLFVFGLIFFTLFYSSAFLWFKEKKKDTFIQQKPGVSTPASKEAKKPEAKISSEPKELWIFREAYPDVQFLSEYDNAKKDWKISITVEKRRGIFYWCEGRMLPEKELSNKDKYWTLLYGYERELKDPADFTQEEIKRIKEFTTREQRIEGPGTPPFFYDLIYDCKTRLRVEEHIVKHSFLGKKTNCHQRITAVLDRVQKRIIEASEKDPEIQAFVKNLLSADCYTWRQIRDSNSRSFHSVGIAMDVLPRGWGQKNLYWAWRRDLDPDNWMMLPLEKRWMPPQKVIDIFEEEGFIWGGKWIIWDNMHFEYHPEIILKNYGRAKSFSR